MWQARNVEILVGIIIAAVFAALFMYTMKISNLSITGDEPGYDLLARYNNIGGLKVRSSVTVAGVRVGRVSKIEYDDKVFEAVVHMRIEPSYRNIPEDSLAKIYTAGVLGEQYISITPGASGKMLADGEIIKKTEDAMLLEDVIAEFFKESTMSSN